MSKQVHPKSSQGHLIACEIDFKAGRDDAERLAEAFSAALE
jgi:hypothetical protein